MLLMVKGEPVRAWCVAGKHTYVPTERETLANIARGNPAFMCTSCRARIAEQLRRGESVYLESVS